METTGYGSIRRSLAQAGDAVQSRATQPLPPGTSDTPNRVTSGLPDIPRSIYLSMLFIGMWRPCRPNHREQSDVLTIDEESNGEDNMCSATPDTSTGMTGNESSSEEIDFIAEAEVLNMKKICSSLKRNDVLSCSSCFFTSMIMFVLALFATYIIAWIATTWGKDGYLLDTLSFLCYITQTFSIVAFALFNRIQNIWTVITKNSLKIPRTFDMDFIRNRTGIVQKSSDENHLQNPLKIGRFIIFLSFPVLTAVIGLALKCKIILNGCSSMLSIMDALSSVTFINYGCFWFLVYVHRISLQHQLSGALRNLKQLAQTDDRDRARRLIDHTYTEYHLIRKLTGLWMEITLLSVTILSLCTATFSYYNSKTEDDQFFGEEANTDYLLAWSTYTMWMQNVMFIVIPLSALGGINLEYLWQRFRYNIFRSKINEHESFWQAVGKYVNEIDTLGRLDLKLTAGFPLIGIFVYRVMLQDFDRDTFRFWGSRIYCNLCSNITLPKPEL